MQQRQIVFGLLAPADENAAEAVHPTVRPLHDPTPRLIPCLPLERLSLLPPCLDVGREAELRDEGADLVVVIAFIHTHPLRRVGAGPGAFGVVGDTLQRGFDQLHVVAVGAVHRYPDRDAVGLDQQAALDAPFGPVGRVFPGLFPPRGVPWSCTRPYSATTSRCLSSRRRPSDPSPTGPGRRPPSPSVGSGRGRWNRGRSGWRRGPSTDSRCGARRGWPPCRRGRGWAVCRRRRDAGSPAAGSTRRCSPRDRPECSIGLPPARVPWPALTERSCPGNNVSCTLRL